MNRPPEMIGKYKIIDLIATGGMGAVYKGVHPTLDCYVIIKKLTLRGNPDFAERFRREAKILMDFRNDNIVDIYDHFKEGRSHYIVLEYIDGLSLEQLIRRERYLSNDMALYIFREVCKALDYAHKRRVVHRDIKPANILISKKGEVKLVDFGIASSKEEDGEAGLTRDGMTLGSPSYMAPEQFENSRNVDQRADIYSLGVMLYESVTGKKPYPGGYTADLIAAITKGKHPAPRRLNPKVNRFVSSIVKKTMHPKPRRRYQNLTSLLRSLDRYFHRKPVEALKEQLKKAISGGTLESTPRKKLGKLRRFFSIALPLFFLLFLLLGGAYRSGWYQRLFLADSYGELRIALHLDHSYKEPKDLYLRGWLFADTGEDGTALDIDPIHFRLLPSQEREGDLNFVSRRVFLPSGDYRLKVQIENNLFWNTFRLHTIKEQHNLYQGEQGRTITLCTSSHTLPLSVDFFVQDCDTWVDITPISLIELKTGGRWTPWSDELAEGLTTGSVYRFRISAPGYTEKEFSLLIREDQSTLYLNPRLEKSKL